MSGMLRYPNITAPTQREQLEQVKNYLHQLVEQLNQTAAGAGSVVMAAPVTGRQTTREKEQDFQRIKALIIKSAQVVEVLSQAVEKRLEGQYLAVSEFGTFSQQTAQQLSANAEQLQLVYENLQQLTPEVEGLEDRMIGVTAHIKTGLLEYGEDGVPLYGLEIGQRSQVDGQEVFHKYARFTAGMLAFYDRSGTQVAYISDRKLYITHAQITGSFLVGSFLDTVQPDGSVVTKWAG